MHVAGHRGWTAYPVIGRGVGVGVWMLGLEMGDEDGELGAVLDVEDAEEIGDEVLDGFLGVVKGVGDLGVGVALAEESEDAGVGRRDVRAADLDAGFEGAAAGAGEPGRLVHESAPSSCSRRRWVCSPGTSGSSLMQSSMARISLALALPTRAMGIVPTRWKRRAVRR